MRLDGCFAPRLSRWLATVPKNSTVDLELVPDGSYEALQCEAITPSGVCITATIRETRDRRGAAETEA